MAVNTLTPPQDQSPSLVRRLPACGLSLLQAGYQNKGTPIPLHSPPDPAAVPTPAEMEEFKPRKRERGGEGFEAESWDGVAGERD